MKANAPKKIYIPRLEGNETFVHEWSATKFRKYFSREVVENVEYTRTDAFIEKAAKWINEHTSLSEKLVVENFINYMKGE